MGLIVATLVIVLAASGIADAAVFTVNSTADEADLAPGMAGCFTAAGKCTLRAAIEESNLASASVNEIGFDSSVFSGQAAGTIDLGGGLPPITQPVLIEGGRCQTESGVIGPCVTINGTNSSAALTVKSDETAINNLHILNASIGIEVVAGSEGFEILGNWFGGGPSSGPLLGGDATGILIGPGSGGGVVGGKESVDGNLFLSGVTGIEIHGASHVRVLGNRFSFEPDGTASERHYLIDIQITSAPNAGYEAIENEIGTTLSQAALATPACDGGCNLMARAEYTLISGSLNGMYGEHGPPVDTRISGNDIGLNAAGTAAVPTNGGISFGGPGTIIGGPGPRDGNRIVGVWDAISAWGPELTVANNLIGVDSTGSNILAPAHGGIAVYSEFKDPSFEAAVVENVVVVNGGKGISNSGLGATIAGNEVLGADIGIYTQDDQGLQGNLIEANSVGDSSEEGIYLEDSDNEVLGNEVFASGNANIAIAGQQPAGATGNVIGGNSEASENELSQSGGPAISIWAREGTENEVARNYGFENDGPFIQLSPINWSETIGPNGGIEPPEFSSATATDAAGTAEPGALVRVFRNEYEDEGEIESFLGQVAANGKGEWSLAFEGVPAGTVLVATQTLNGGTSEVALAPTPEPPAEEAPLQGARQPQAVTPLSLPPLDTKIIEGPRRRGRSVRFRFRSNRPDATFECRLDRQRFRACDSPKAYRGLTGRHAFQVRAVASSGEVDPSPARRAFAMPKVRRHGRRG